MQDPPDEGHIRALLQAELLLQKPLALRLALHGTGIVVRREELIRRRVPVVNVDAVHNACMGGEREEARG